MLVRLYEASVVGDWETGKSILDERPDLLRIDPLGNFGTALHMATTADETKFTLNFVKNLVDMMEEEDLEIKNAISNTAFWRACLTGKTKMAMIMMKKNPRLPDIRGNKESFPLCVCARSGTHELVKILYNYSQKMKGSHWTNKDRSRTLFHCVERDFFDIALQILEDHPELALSIFHIAVMHRHQDIYNLLYEVGRTRRNDICIIRDNSGNNMLHLVGKTSKERAAKTSGAPLLMQRELLWFKDVEEMMPPYKREEKNNDGQTPYELFAKENEELVSKGLKWMKDCMVVATLIVTVAFAVAFTVPGGYNQDHGSPIFIHNRTFLVFVIADAVSLISSSTSLLVFLSVFTSQHDQRDFMYSLPRKLMIGLLTLFISVAALMVTFSASFFVLYHKGLKWVSIC
ncbi:hypothetical protein E3N88_38326 [Mikania micrantha]|uniref:PGG domain-containing protein n=1 Tax=Mikania micrantha TaxID=192012 RepID=A0A5N6LTQ2_9ASTR|nr:hypothetical protein E3N88_38326 [Mikania micrantha]